MNMLHATYGTWLIIDESLLTLYVYSSFLVRAMAAQLKSEPWVYTGAAVDLSEGDKKDGEAKLKEEDVDVIQRLTAELK